MRNKILVRRRIPILISAAVLAVTMYILVSLRQSHLGFPLDDAWIYQTYARNLVQFHAWVYQQGQVAGGATGPLWVVLLAVGYLAGIHPFLWAYFLGIGFLFGIGLAAAEISDVFFPENPKLGTLGGVLIVLEWHHVWSAVSGMETLFFVFLVMVTFWLFVQSSKTNGLWLLIGIIVGLSVWVRPDGLTLLGPALFLAVIQPPRVWGKLKACGFVLIGFGVVFGFYLLFNFRISGAFWPNTFYAKQAEYMIRRDIPYWRRYLQQMFIPLTGAGLLLLPGLMIGAYRAVRGRSWAWLAMLFWVLGFSGVYAFRLPVVYQHGRYAIPVISVYCSLSFVGFVPLLRGQKKRIGLIFSQSWVLSLVIVLIMFLILGARAYSQDVAVINTEMVATAKWIERETHPDAVVAAHDIGAIGYFSDRSLVDLAGLVSPEVIPIIRNEDELSRFLTQKNVDYLVTFPGWYPQLVKGLKVVYKSGGNVAPMLGGENMVVYKWKP